MGVQTRRRVAEAPRQPLAQLEPGAQETHLDIDLGQAQGLGRLAYRQPLHVAEQEDDTVLLVQLGQGFLDQPSRTRLTRWRDLMNVRSCNTP